MEISHVMSGIIFCVCSMTAISVLQFVFKKLHIVQKEAPRSRCQWWGLMQVLILVKKFFFFGKIFWWIQQGHSNSSLETKVQNWICRWDPNHSWKGEWSSAKRAEMNSLRCKRRKRTFFVLGNVCLWLWYWKISTIVNPLLTRQFFLQMFDISTKLVFEPDEISGLETLSKLFTIECWKSLVFSRLEIWWTDGRYNGETRCVLTAHGPVHNWKRWGKIFTPKQDQNCRWDPNHSFTRWMIRCEKGRKQSWRDATKDSDNHHVILGMFTFVTLQASVFMGKTFSDILHSTKNTEDLTMQKMFHIFEKLVRTFRRDLWSENNWIDWKDCSWKYLFWICDEQVIGAEKKWYSFSADTPEGEWDTKAVKIMLQFWRKHTSSFACHESIVQRSGGKLSIQYCANPRHDWNCFSHTFLWFSWVFMESLRGRRSSVWRIWILPWWITGTFGKKIRPHCLCHMWWKHTH